MCSSDLLSGSEVPLVSGIGKGNFYCEYCFYFYLLLCLIMEKSPFSSLFGNNTADAEVVDEAPHVSEIPFKIPMKIVERVITTVMKGMELSILVSIYCFYMNYASCSSV